MRVCAMQCAQRWPHAARGRHQAYQETGSSEAQPAPDDQTRQPEIRQLENVPRQRVLVGGLEVTNRFVVRSQLSIAVLLTTDYGPLTTNTVTTLEPAALSSR